MNPRFMAALAVAAALAAPAAAQAPGHIQSALADKGRPAADTARDAARKPGELLAWAGVKPGDQVADLIMGGGYLTRVLAVAVGPKGKVHAFQPTEFIKFQASYGEQQKTVAGAYPNVTPITQGLGELDLPDGLDLVITVQNYHDLHLTPFPKDTAAKVNAEVFKSLKPGGTYVIVDHSAVAGAPLDVAMTLHRIDPAVVRKEVEAAGFRFEGESQMFRAEADPRTASAFDASIRSKTDQFAMKFRKPK